MSLHALRKRETTELKQGANCSTRTTLFKKANNNTNNNKSSSSSGVPTIILTTTSPRNYSTGGGSSKQKLIRQRKLLGRASLSNPDLTEFRRTIECNLLRSRSEGDVSTLELAGNTVRGLTAANAKSEVCLQSISSRTYEPRAARPTMLGGARSHRDLSSGDRSNMDMVEDRTPRRMSECSLGYSQSTSGGGGGGGGGVGGVGTYSQRSSSMFASQMTLSSAGGAGIDSPLRVPIIGYEVMEERARFTVYKLRVENPDTNDCWLVMRRYTDFVRLNGKLKQAFPHINLMLPRKKLFGDNFNAVFLDNRVQGLQMFVNSIMAKEQLRKNKLVREFFCLDEPPSYSESMEECRAIFEAQEETIVHLKLQIQAKNDLILSLQQKLREEMLEKQQLREDLKNINLDCSHCSSANDSSSLKQ